jgi:hypothetical protein
MKSVYLVICFIACLGGCKKEKNNTGGGGGTPAAKYTPNLIALAYQPGVPPDPLAFNIYDLNHDDNAEKKFLRVKFVTIDSVAVVTAPASINNLAPSWPADVKKVQFGSGAQFIVNDQFYIGISGSVFNKVNYNQTSPQHAWLTIHKKLPAGAPPNGEVSFSPSDYRIFYFSTRLMSSYTGGSNYILAEIGSIAGLGAPFNIYNWTDVSSCIYLSTAPRFYFFDFKNWNYWTVFRDPTQNGAWVGDPVKSLNSFVKWPDEWGKK